MKLEVGDKVGHRYVSFCVCMVTKGDHHFEGFINSDKFKIDVFIKSIEKYTYKRKTRTKVMSGYDEEVYKEAVKKSKLNLDKKIKLQMKKGYLPVAKGWKVLTPYAINNRKGGLICNMCKTIPTTNTKMFEEELQDE